MKYKSIVITAILVVLQLCSSLSALPTTASEAEMVVQGWLKTDPQPLNTAIGQEVTGVETFTDDNGEPIYYIVYLEPSGFVIVSADDSVEPIIGFADDGTYDPSLDNPLGALVTNDLNGRMSAVQNTFKLQALVGEAPVLDTQRKWGYFLSLAETSEDGFSLMARYSISDVRVAPLVRSKWSQTTACDRNCYNYYTPNHYPSGCVATAMAQLMRFHQYPVEPDDSVRLRNNIVIGRQSFTITVNGRNETRYLKGGDGDGGPYKWNLMDLLPGCVTSFAQRQAIGALCYDAGISTNTEYTANGSWTNLVKARESLLTTFKYENAISGWNYDYFTETFRNLGSGLKGMVNPNLDAGYPVILGLTSPGGGHAVLADGYGYNFSTQYYHLNMGWSGNHDAWYNLPTIDSNPSFNVIDECVYNIFTSGNGEIISGRVTDEYGNPVRGAQVTATELYSDLVVETYSDETNDKGIYAISGLDSNTRYTVNVNKTGYNFGTKEVTTGKSSNGSSVSGNRWGINFIHWSYFEPPVPEVEVEEEHLLRANAAWKTANGTAPHISDRQECFSHDNPSYMIWKELGKPDCWCFCYQSLGDADGQTEGKQKYRVGINDLEILKECWGSTAGDLSFNPCADFDHDGMVGPSDLKILISNWRKTDDDLSGDCPDNNIFLSLRKRFVTFEK